MAKLEDRIRKILSNKKIMEFSNEEWEKYHKSQYKICPTIAPCIHDDDCLCKCRIEWFVREIMKVINETCQ
jgi:hypothetical protein